MFDRLFKPMSPLMGWFILMELITVACLGGYWVEILCHGIKPWDHPGIGLLATGLFIVSNWLLFRHRRWAAAGLAICWLLLALMMTV